MFTFPLENNCNCTSQLKITSHFLKQNRTIYTTESRKRINGYWTNKFHVQQEIELNFYALSLCHFRLLAAWNWMKIIYKYLGLKSQNVNLFCSPTKWTVKMKSRRIQQRKYVGDNVKEWNLSYYFAHSSLISSEQMH